MKKNITTALLIAAILSFNMSCMKKQNLDDDNLGDPIKPAALLSAISDGLGTYSYDIKQDESSSYVLSQSVQAGTPYNLEQQDLTVTAVVATNTSIKFDSLVTKTIYSDNQTSQSIPRSWSYQIGSDPATQNSKKSDEEAKPNAELEPPLYLFRMLESVAYTSCEAEGENAAACYQLHFVDFKLRVSPSMATQHQCANVNQCYIEARKIEFDTVSYKVLDKDNKPLRIHYTMTISKDVPFLSKMLQLCYRRLYTITSSQQKVMADTCYSVNNYTFGR
ncbi:MAG: hypothetical protein H7328_12800 [Bdellovibrio sp.]|nr:hypothetical protein [Bdellovibrio sp.]